MVDERRFLNPKFDAEALLDLCPSDSDGSFCESVDDFEKELVANNPSLAKEIAELDRTTYKSNKEAKRDREASLTALAATQGRSLFDQKKLKFNLPNVLQNMHLDHVGPLKLLVNALETRSRIELRIRSHVRIDRIACGLLTSFDYQLNIVLHDADEIKMTKKKGGSAQNSVNGVQEEPEPVTSQNGPLNSVDEIANDVKSLNLGGKEKGELMRQQKSKEEVMAERKAKSEAKAAKAAAAAAKKAGGEATAAPSQKQQQQAKQPKEKKSEPEQSKPKPTSSSDVIKESSPGKEEPKSALKTTYSKTHAKEVQFDLTANTVKSGSEENLSDKQQRPNSLPPLSPTPSDVGAYDALSTAHVHPAFLTLATKCEQELITEVDQLCQQFIESFKKFLSDWGAERIRTPGVDSTQLGNDLDHAIRPQLAFLTNDGRWPLPYALGNIIRQMKKEIKKLGQPDTHARTLEDGTCAKALPGGCQKLEDLNEWLDFTMEGCFKLATQAISEHLRKKMKTAPKIITYDWCPVVNQVLLDACDDKLNHTIVVLDQQMNGKGIRHSKSLIQKGVKTEYGDLRSLGYAMNKCSMVLLGCSAVLSNGCVACAKGALQVALVAKASNVPLMVCAQTFKFVDKVQTYGRMSLLGREDVELVPADLVTAIVTDIRILPPSSAPAVLKAKALDME